MKTLQQAYSSAKAQMKSQLKSADWFLISFEDWCQLWMNSGHYEQRGRMQLQYAMVRQDDTKPLTKDNAVIILNSERVRRVNLGKKFSDETKEKMRQAKLGVPKSEEHKRNMSIASRAAHERKGHTMKSDKYFT